MSNTTELSEAKRALLEKYLQGNRQQKKTGSGTIPQRTKGSVVPLSFGQQQMWLLSQLITAPVYNETITVHLPGPLAVAPLEQSFNEIIRRHEAWRTNFPVIDGQPVQMVQPTRTFTLPVVDLRHLPEAERETEAIRIVTEKALLPFDLAHDPLLRPTLIRLADADHRLYLTMHHIIFDGISHYQIFLPELRTLYEAYSTGHPSPLPELPLQYGDFAVWQREWLQGNVLSEQLNYWKQQLLDAPTILELPSDRPRPAHQSYQGNRSPFTIPRPLTDKLKALGHHEGVTLYMTLVAAFQTLFYRYTNQEDILISTATGDRKPAETQQLLGYFLNTVVLRTRISGNLIFRELLKHIREVILDAHAHQDLPFEYLVRELQPERHLGYNPIVQVMMSLEPPFPVLPCGWTITLTDIQTKTARFDVCMELDERPEGLVGWFEYSTDLFDESTIIRMIGHWQTLLASIVQNPAQPIAELPLLTEGEQRQLLIEWNNSATDYPKDQCLHQLFEAQVKSTPDAVAVVFDDTTITYRALNSKANQLAHYLQRLGVKPEVLVGICVERSLDMLVALLGILKSGGAYVPLDPSYPQERLAFMLQDAQVHVLVTQGHLRPQLPQSQVRTVLLDYDWSEIALCAEENPSSQIIPDNLAYVLYTSGSTGTPKGTMIHHRGLVNYLTWATKKYEVEQSKGSLVYSSLSFDLTVTGLFAPLLSGRSVTLANEDKDALIKALSKGGFSFVKLTPAHLELLAQWLPPEVAAKATARLIVGGEALYGESLNYWRQHAPNTRIINEYGPTETVVGCSIFELAARDAAPGAIPIGRPIANVNLYVLDTHRQPVAVGVSGELYIGGDGLARGYLNRPELTSERFIPHPFSTIPGERLYRTGDLVRYRPDGIIEFLGRIDHQVKLRGFRIELGEIEETLRQSPEVQETVVVVREDTHDDKRLVAYVVPTPGQTPTTESLRNVSKKRLPEYMVPSSFIFLDVLPLTPNGKVDRNALPVPETTREATEDTYVAPSSLVQQQLIEIWEELLNIRPIGIRDNFFSLGGHSLLAARMVNKIEQICGKKLPLSALFADATIEHLVHVLLEGTDKTSHTPFLAIQTQGTKRPFFYFHGDWTGAAFYCLQVARSLGMDQPFYALEPYKFDALAIPPTFEDVAKAHIQSIRAIQPEGPYLLGGWCTGGLTIYEMARQLRAQGQEVDLLVMLDPTPPAHLKSIRRTISQLGTLLRQDENIQLNWFLHLRHIYRYLRYSHYRKTAHEASTKTLIPSKVQQKQNRKSLIKSKFAELVSNAKTLRKDWTGIFEWVASAYDPDLYPDKLTFLWDSEDPKRRAGWEKVLATANAISYDMPGTHITCRTEHLPELIEHLRLCLNQAQETETTSVE